ncbi:MAG: proteasome assembly chaperone family protein [Nitrosopumilus sp.]|nr:proteasome assembly chaperone family protein [Nitrosopumilus sp.]MBT3574052.1 proteasome assembly chaperone family protein [Nitrosopumilus sp.]MBT3861302.1 proteasome assembly chaperone family protein [Nitrosopumilus sp.]MBT3956201.1 proteasome assembly chaperone family protein [Nitrosopumilus sp.]MBT4298593.1 proteasome assembly chaperone family protein [Nitrosopumilus sp.]
MMKVDSKEKILLVGFPSNGLVGMFSISYLIHHLKMNKIDEIQVKDIPPTVFVEDGKILAPIRAYSQNNLFVIVSDVPLDQFLAIEFVQAIHKFCKKYQIKKIIIVSGMETIHNQIKTPKIYGLSTHISIDEILSKNQIPKFLDGSIFGIDAVFISVFKKTKIPLLFLYAECNPYFPDPVASIAAITTLAKVLDVKINTTDIQKKIEHLRIQHRNLMEETTQTLRQQQEKHTRNPQIYR